MRYRQAGTVARISIDLELNLYAALWYLSHGLLERFPI